MAGCDWLHPAEVDRLYGYNPAALHLPMSRPLFREPQVGFFTPFIHL
ncbi:unnamed protein product, partial [Ectocarpus sp. 12 AP-2014]